MEPKREPPIPSVSAASLLGEPEVARSHTGAPVGSDSRASSYADFSVDGRPKSLSKKSSFAQLAKNVSRSGFDGYETVLECLFRASLATRIENLALSDAGSRFPRLLTPPPVSAAMLAEWCGARKGRARLIRPPSSSPATDCTMLTSSASAGESGGRMPGRHAASRLLPAPGGPLISRLDMPTLALISAVDRYRNGRNWAVCGLPASGSHMA